MRWRWRWPAAMLCSKARGRNSCRSALDRIAEPAPQIDATNDGIRVRRNGAGIAAGRCETAPFPGFPTDLQAQFMALMTMAKGTSRITETIFENRFMHVQELARLGAHIRLEGDRRSSKASSGSKARRSWRPTCAPRCRSSSPASRPRARRSVNRVYHLDRGFERLEEKLSACGAEIERLSPPAERGRAVGRTEMPAGRVLAAGLPADPCSRDMQRSR